MMLKEVVLLAWRSVYSNKLRSGITIAIISLGIMALIGITTAIEAMNQSLRESFSLLGANSFVIRYKDFQTDFGNNSGYEKKSVNGKIKKAIIQKPITKINAEYFKNNFHFANCKVAIWRVISGQTLYYENKETSPQMRVVGGDENYITVNAFQLKNGRNLNLDDIRSARYVCILGATVVNKLFDGNADRAIGKTIKVGTIKYLVIGTLKEKGTSAQMRSDDIILTSYNNLRYLSGLITNRFGNNSSLVTYSIGVETESVLEMNSAMNRATSLIRNIRYLRPTDSDNFVFIKSDKFAELFIGLLSNITGASSLIGFITLISAAISLMNIMLVSVNERNREVGLIKALGGKKSFIRNQFLSESIIISILGAIFGIIVGVLLGNSVSLILDTNFVIPWGWISIGIIMCTIVGLLAGLYPAVKASKLNPIQVLRSE